MPEGVNPSFTRRLRSVRFALEGIATMLRSQHNAWVHVAATVAVVRLGRPVPGTCPKSCHTPHIPE